MTQLSQMTQLIHQKWFHLLIRVFFLQKIARFILHVLSPKFRYRGIVYRIRSPESISIATEVFKSDTYDAFFKKKPQINTVIDLGCNTGFFTCLLGSYSEEKSLKGVLVDADENVLKESVWHLEKNQLDQCDTVCAIIGPAHQKNSDFYISEFNISSSTRPIDTSYPFPMRTIKTINRPVITLQKLIQDTFPNERVNVLKIDIEGSEKELLDQNLACLDQVDWIIIEWHKWVIQLKELTHKLSAHQFECVDILKEDTLCGLGLFKNTSLLTQTTD